MMPSVMESIPEHCDSAVFARQHETEAESVKQQ